MLGKPKIGIDIDGCIVEMSERIRSEGEKRFGVIYKPEDVTRFNLINNGFTRPQVEDIIFDWDVLETLEEIPFAREALDILWEDYEIHVVSARKKESLFPTMKWLKEHKISHDILELEHVDKSKYVVENKLVWFVEDRYKNAIEISEVCPVYLINRTHNDRPTNGRITRVDNWTNILGSIYAD